MILSNQSNVASSLILGISLFATLSKALMNWACLEAQLVTHSLEGGTKVEPESLKHALLQSLKTSCETICESDLE